MSLLKNLGLLAIGYALGSAFERSELKEEIPKKFKETFPKEFDNYKFINSESNKTDKYDSKIKQIAKYNHDKVNDYIKKNIRNTNTKFNQKSCFDAFKDNCNNKQTQTNDSPNFAKSYKESVSNTINYEPIQQDNNYQSEKPIGPPITDKKGVLIDVLKASYPDLPDDIINRIANETDESLKSFSASYSIPNN